MKFKIFILPLILIALSSCDRTDHPQFQGYIEGENIFLASPFYGTLLELKVLRGQHVTKDQLLFKLDPNPQAINVTQAESELEQAQNTLIDLEKPKRLPEITAIEAQIEQAKAQVELAELRVGRFTKLYTKQATDKDSLDAAKANLEQQKQLQMQYESNLALAKLGGRDDQIKAQKAQINSLVAKLNQAKWELNQKSVSAPASGVIFDTYYHVGEFVANQQPVVSLLTPENIRIEFFVPLEYSSKLKVGRNITFNCEGCDSNNTAVISYISPDAEFIPPLVYSRDNYSKLVFRIKAQIANPFSFKPGQPVTVNL